MLNLRSSLKTGAFAAALAVGGLAVTVPVASADVAELGRRFFAVGSRFRLDLLRVAARKLAADTAWRKLAIGALIEDLYGHQADLTARAMSGGEGAFEVWLQTHAAEISHLDALVTEILQAPAADLAMLTVANRHLRALVAA